MKTIKTEIIGEKIATNSPESYSLNKKSYFGKKVEDKIQYSASEALYLLETKKIEIYSKNKKITFKELIQKIKRFDKKIEIKYPVFKDLRSKGYIVKTGLKFGSDFRVYPKGKTMNQSHAKWIVYVESGSKKINWTEFTSKNRVAHSTKKKLLLALVDEENSISYYETSWIKI